MQLTLSAQIRPVLIDIPLDLGEPSDSVLYAGSPDLMSVPRSGVHVFANQDGRREPTIEVRLLLRIRSHSPLLLALISAKPSPDHTFVCLPCHWIGRRQPIHRFATTPRRMRSALKL